MIPYYRSDPGGLSCGSGPLGLPSQYPNTSMAIQCIHLSYLSYQRNLKIYNNKKKEKEIPLYWKPQTQRKKLHYILVTRIPPPLFPKSWNRLCHTKPQPSVLALSWWLISASVLVLAFCLLEATCQCHLLRVTRTRATTESPSNLFLCHVLQKSQ